MVFAIANTLWIVTVMILTTQEQLSLLGTNLLGKK